MQSRSTGAIAGNTVAGTTTPTTTAAAKTARKVPYLAIDKDGFSWRGNEKLFSMIQHNNNCASKENYYSNSWRNASWAINSASGAMSAVATKSAICEFDSVALAKTPSTAADLSENKLFKRV